jgi:hypothetical protein
MAYLAFRTDAAGRSDRAHRHADVLVAGAAQAANITAVDKGDFLDNVFR